MSWTVTIPQYPQRKKKLPTLAEVLANPNKAEHHVEPRDVDMFQMLYLCRFLTTHQIHHLFWSTKGLRSCELRLTHLYDRGFLDRFRPPSVKGEGSYPYVYVIDSLGYQLLRHLRHDVICYRWEHREKTPEYSRVIHDLELNDFAIRFRDEAGMRFSDADPNFKPLWLTTRQSAQRVKRENGHSIYAPDAILAYDVPEPKVPGGVAPVVLHIEWERSADKEHFRTKLDIWRHYRTAQLWRERGYASEPIVLVVGRKREAGRAGMYSIEPLRQIADQAGFSNLYFLHRETYEAKKEPDGTGWEVLTPTGHKLNLWDLRSSDLWQPVLQPLNGVL